MEQVVDLAHPLLEQVGPPGGALGQEGEGVRRLRVLAEHDHADLGMGGAEVVGGLDSLVGAGRGHADVGDDHVGCALVDQGEQRGKVAGDTDEVEVHLAVDDARDPFAYEEVVLGEDDTQHGAHGTCRSGPETTSMGRSRRRRSAWRTPW